MRNTNFRADQIGGVGHRILICSTPGPGHVNPMLTVARHLRSAGHSVIFNTAEIFRKQVESAGLQFVPLKGLANFDYRHLDDAFPERKNFKPGPDQLAHDFKFAFGRPIAAQYRVIRRLMHETRIDLIMADLTFMGTFPLLLGATDVRPPVISCGVSVVFLSSEDVSPFGAPGPGEPDCERNRQDNLQFQAIFKSVQDDMNAALQMCGAEPMSEFFLDSWYTLPDRFLQFTAEEFEYPRRNIPLTMQFAGPMLPQITSHFQKPDWWTDLDGPRPVVLVTQGTIANEDLSQLIEPTLTGLDGEKALVVVATGGRDAGTISIPIPANARVEQFIPFSEIFPKVDVFVTNGGYGAVQQALSAGVPIVVAGTTEDKPFVAARVAWSGAGISLVTDRPSARQVQDAVRTVLRDSAYRNHARRLQAKFTQYDSLRAVKETVASFLASGDIHDRRLPSIS
jgi:MGT family glycosyltransferase